MMKQNIIFVILMLCVISPLVTYAGEVREIVLNDNSVIVGELVSVNNGIYTIKTTSLGILEVAEERVMNIGNRSGSIAGKSVDADLQEMGAIKQKMIGDSSIMQTILGLEDDSDFQDILQDESIMKAINSGDYGALLTNPKLIKLMEKSSVQEIKKNLK
ncbi:MAG: hypothetical protein ACI8ZB_003079 [Desulforhopalus sp.]|jgi:hypothetical protein